MQRILHLAFLFVLVVLSASAETTFAVVQNGVVVNVIVADQSFVDAHFPGSPRVDNLTPQPSIGWGYDGTTWTAPQTFAIVTGGVVAQVVTGLASKVLVQYPGAVRIDTLNPMPAVGWTYDGTTFTAPAK